VPVTKALQAASTEDATCRRVAADEVAGHKDPRWRDSEALPICHASRGPVS
jgi:hypothetical protein